MRFYGLISKLVILLIRKEMHRSNIQLLEDKKGKNLPREVYLLARRSHVKLIAETRFYICHKNMKSTGFLLFFESFWT